MDPFYFSHSRSERLIAIGRVVLVAFSLLAIWLDPAEPVKDVETAYTWLILYLGYALLLLPLAWRLDSALDRFGIITHIVDLPFFTLYYVFHGRPHRPLLRLFCVLSAGRQPALAVAGDAMDSARDPDHLHQAWACIQRMSCTIQPSSSIALSSIVHIWR